MRTVGIIGGNGSALLEGAKRLARGGLRFVDAAAHAGGPLDALIVWDAQPALIKSVRMLREGAYLIINIDKREILPLLSNWRGALRLLTFGFNGKACVTASSTSDGVLCVQHSFKTLDGALREPCEFGFPLENNCVSALGFAAALLVCGII